MNLFEESIAIAKGKMVENNGFYPTFIAETLGGKRLIIICPWASEKEKALAIDYVRLLFLKEDVVEYVFMSEMWFKSVGSLEDRPEGLIADLPDKREGIMVISGKLETDKIVTQSKIFEVKRTNGIELSPFPDSPDTSGSFAEMLTLKKLTSAEKTMLDGFISETERRYGFIHKRTLH